MSKLKIKEVIKKEERKKMKGVIMGMAVIITVAVLINLIRGISHSFKLITHLILIAGILYLTAKTLIIYYK